jgi:glycosyltransferase involved in cell wall biosynthesis
VAFDGRLATGQRRGIGKGELELLRRMVVLPAPIQFEILTDRHPDPTLIEPQANWRWTVLAPAAYPLWEQVRLPVYARRRRPTVLHAPGNSAPRVRPPPSTRFVVTVHDFIFLEPWRLTSARQRLGRIYRRWALPAAITRADWLICVSNATREQLLRRYPEQAERVSVIPTAIGDDLFVSEPDSRVETTSFLAFGGIDPRKNVDRIVQAFSQVRAQLPDAELVLVGAQGGLRGQHAQGVRALGYVTEPELRALYRQSAALVYPSLSEGFGVPILEAMALGVPVITADRDPMRELGGDVAILVDPEKTDAIASAMIQVSRGRDALKATADRGRRRAQAFAASRVAEQVVELYLRLAGMERDT